jgi:hypothetical protein
MPTPTYTPLATVTLGSTATVITFSSIPATPYRDLIIQGQIGPFSPVMLGEINGSGSNFTYFRIYGDNTTASASIGSDNNIGDSFGASSPISFVWQFLDYSVTDKHKSSLIRVGSSTGRLFAGTLRWAQTTAINSISIKANTGSFPAGTTLSLYGIVS